MINHLQEILSEELISILGSILPTLIALIYFFVSKNFIQRKKKSDEPTFAEKLESSIEQLKSASKNMDNLVGEITTLTSEKHEKLSKLELELQMLSQREEETRKKIEVLKQVPIEALQHFEEIMKPGEKRSARRDYFLFAAGALFSIISTIILKLLGYA